MIQPQAHAFADIGVDSHVVVDNHRSNTLPVQQICCSIFIRPKQGALAPVIKQTQNLRRVGQARDLEWASASLNHDWTRCVQWTSPTTWRWALDTEAMTRANSTSWVLSIPFGQLLGSFLGCFRRFEASAGAAPLSFDAVCSAFMLEICCLIFCASVHKTNTIRNRILNSC